MYDGLSRVAGRGVPFSVQINSMGVGDNFMASSDYLSLIHISYTLSTGTRL